MMMFLFRICFLGKGRNMQNFTRLMWQWKLMAKALQDGKLKFKFHFSSHHQLSERPKPLENIWSFLWIKFFSFFQKYFNFFSFSIRVALATVSMTYKEPTAAIFLFFLFLVRHFINNFSFLSIHNLELFFELNVHSNSQFWQMHFFEDEKIGNKEQTAKETSLTSSEKSVYTY